MSTTTQKQHATLGKLTKSAVESRLKAARAQRRQMKAEGKPLPSPTKMWSKKSLKSLKIALGGGQPVAE